MISFYFIVSIIKTSSKPSGHQNGKLTPKPNYRTLIQSKINYHERQYPKGIE